MKNLIKNIQNFAHQNDLWQKNAKIVIGVSGGADSVCLLYILIFLSKKYDFSLHIAHINYDLRGKDSLADEKFVTALAEKNGISISILNAKKLKIKNVSENALRAVRYTFFEKIRSELGFDLIAVAHNQDDQAETVLLRLMRGSGLEGISSIKAKNSRLIRPLLATSRKDIIVYLKAHQIKFRTDKTNLKPVFTRNKVRLQLIPYLEKHFNPRIKETLATFARNTTDEFAFIEISAKKKGNFVKKTATGVTFDSQKMLALEPAIRRQCLRDALKTAKKDFFNIESSHIEEIEKILKSVKNKNQETSFKGLKITRKGDIVKLFCIN